MAAEVAGPRQRLFELDLATGRPLAGYPLDLPGTAAFAEQQRGALTYLGGTVYVPLGGLYGDNGANPLAATVARWNNRAGTTLQSGANPAKAGGAKPWV